MAKIFTLEIVCVNIQGAKGRISPRGIFMIDLGSILKVKKVPEKATFKYKNAYYELVKRENLGKLKKILEKRKDFDRHIIDKITLEEREGLPYLYLLAKSHEQLRETSYAMIDAILVDISSIVPQWPGIFYLPILIIRETKSKKLRQLLRIEDLKKHECLHIREIIEYIDSHPGYIEEAMKYNAGGCTIDDIRGSIGFELKKIFLFEIPALELDYENGQQDLIVYSKGVVTVTRMPGKTKKKYVLFHIAGYIGALQDFYKDRFPGKEKLIDEAFETEVNKRGKALFGKDAMRHIVILRMALFVLSSNTFYSTRYENDGDK